MSKKYPRNFVSKKFAWPKDKTHHFAGLQFHRSTSTFITSVTFVSYRLLQQWFCSFVLIILIMNVSRYLSCRLNYDAQGLHVLPVDQKASNSCSVGVVIYSRTKQKLQCETLIRRQVMRTILIHACYYSS